MIPIFEKSSSEKMSNFVIKSIKLKKQSEQLLALAKTAVEMAIEEDEKIAMNFIRTKLKDLK